LAAMHLECEGVDADKAADVAAHAVRRGDGRGFGLLWRRLRRRILWCVCNHSQSRPLPLCGLCGRSWCISGRSNCSRAQGDRGCVLSDRLRSAPRSRLTLARRTTRRHTSRLGRQPHMTANLATTEPHFDRLTCNRALDPLDHSPTPRATLRGYPLAAVADAITLTQRTVRAAARVSSGIVARRRGIVDARRNKNSTRARG
jgi:hypothetical protein